MPAARTIWRHKKSGGVYVIVGSAMLQISEDAFRKNPPLLDIPEAISAACFLELIKFVVYRSLSNDKMYVRPETEFLDGRFEQV